MRIYLIRHGQSVWNVEGKAAGHGDTPLTDHGREQARKAGVYFKDVLEVSPDAVYASTLSRAYETADIIARELGDYQVVGDDRLQERHIAHFSGMLRSDISKEWRTHENVESDDVLVERFQKAIDDIYKNHPNGEVIIVAHGGNIKYRLGSLGYEVPHRSHNTGITVLDYHPGELQVIAYSLDDHLG